MNKPVYLGLSILELSKILMYEFWYDYEKSKYGEKDKLCYMGTDNFIVHIKTVDVYRDIVEDVETKFDTSIYETECNSIDRPLLQIRNKRVIGLMKDKLGGKTMTTFSGLRAKTDGSEVKKEKGTKKRAIKRKLKFRNYKNCLEAMQLDNKEKYLEKIKLIQIALKEIIKNS